MTNLCMELGEERDTIREEHIKEMIEENNSMLKEMLEILKGKGDGQKV